MSIPSALGRYRGAISSTSKPVTAVDVAWSNRRTGSQLVEDLGREHSALIVADATVSARHARLVVRNAVVTLTDLGSSNGSFDENGNRLVNILGSADASGFLIQIGLFIICAFAAYTGWRHVGVIEPKVWRSYIVVFTLLLLVAFGFLSIGIVAVASLLGEGAPQSDAAQLTTVMALFAVPWFAVIGVAGLIAVLRLRRLRLLPSGRTVAEVASALRARSGESGMNVEGLKRIAPVRGAAFSAAGGIALVAHHSMLDPAHVQARPREAGQQQAGWAAPPSTG